MVKNVNFTYWLKAGGALIILLLFTQTGSAQPIIEVPVLIDITANPSTISRSSFSTITVVLQTEVCGVGCAPIIGYSTGGMLLPPAGVVDSSNRFTTRFNSSISGTFTIIFHSPPWKYGTRQCNVITNKVNVTVINDPPKQSTKPEGPASGSIGTSYTYTTSTTDPNNDQIKYIFDWGDNSKNTTYFLDSGATAGASHIWSSPGIYNIKVSAIDAEGPASEWSAFTTVKIESTPLLSVSPDPLSFNLGTMYAGGTSSHVFSIKNTGGKNLTWAISSDKLWMTMNPTSGTNSDDVVLNINTKGLNPGSYSGTFTVTSNGGTKKGTVSLNIPPATPLHTTTPATPLHTTTPATPLPTPTQTPKGPIISDDVIVALIGAFAAIITAYFGYRFVKKKENS